MKYRISKTKIMKYKNSLKKGFTLVELLAIVVIISVVSLVGVGVYNGVINNMEANSTAFAISSVKSAAELYSKEKSNKINWISFYDSETGEKAGRYVCMTVKQLVNAGFFDENFFDKEIYKNSEIGNNTFFEIKQNVNYSETEVIMHEKDTSKLMCEMSAINDKTSNIDISNVLKFTDRFSFDIELKNDNIDSKEVEYSCYLPGQTGEVSSNSCTFKGLKSGTLYNKINVCINPKEGNTSLTSTICETFGTETLELKEPVIRVSNVDNWKNFKMVNIKYDVDNIYPGSALLDFKIGVNAVFCSNESCDEIIDDIEQNELYRTSNVDIWLKVSENIGVFKKIISAKIQDEAGNYLTTNKKITKIDTVAPVCTSSGGSTTWINKTSSQTKVTIVGTCTDEKGGSGCTKEIITKDYATDIDTTEASPGIVSDKAGNTTTCPGDQTVKIDKTPPTCTTSGGGSWTNSKVTLTGTCSDSGSLCTSTTITKESTTEQNEDQSPGSVMDNAGNSAVCPNNKVMIDKTPPTCTTSGGGSWTNSKVTLIGTCSDSGSLCTSTTITKDYNTEQNSNQSPGSVTDNAGNSTVCPNGKVMIDKTKPTLTVTMYKRKKKSDGTYTSTGNAICTATANNSNNVKMLNNDSCKKNLVKGWYNKTNYPYGVYFKITSSDAGSGIGSKTWLWNNSGATSQPSVDTLDQNLNSDNKEDTTYISGDGYRLARYKVVDNAGNNSYINILLNIDRAGPTIDGMHLKNFYLSSNCQTNNYNLQIKYTDSLSGNDYCNVRAACTSVSDLTTLNLGNKKVDYENLARTDLCKGSKAYTEAYDQAGNKSDKTFTYPKKANHKKASEAWEKYDKCS